MLKVGSLLIIKRFFLDILLFNLFRNVRNEIPEIVFWEASEVMFGLFRWHASCQEIMKREITLPVLLKKNQ